MSPYLNPADLCSNRSPLPANCAEYTINTDCTLIADTSNCELCKNSTLTNQYTSQNAGSNQNLLNMKDEYKRSWYQTGNLGIGILFLLVCIYYQK